MKLLLRLTGIFAALFMLTFGCGAQFAADELYGAIPEEAASQLEESGITPAGGVQELSPGDILGYLAGLVTENAAKPLKMFGTLLAVIMLSALFSGMSDAAGAARTRIYPLVTSAASAVIVSLYLSDIINTASSAFGAAADMMLVYLPVVGGVTAMGGHTASAAIFTSVTLTAIQLLARIASSVIIPLTGCIIGITAAGSAGSDLALDRLAEGIKKLVIWGLGLIMTLFLGILSVQTMITASSDNAALRTLKFTVSSAVPIVGGAVSEALSTVSGSISLLRTSIGGFGIAAGAVILAPAVVTALCYRFFLFAAGVVSDIFGCAETGKMIKSGENVMAVVIAVLSCFFVFITVSTAILLTFCRS